MPVHDTGEQNAVHEMTRPASVARLGAEFDNFLFAPIGEGRNGTLLTVLSALARLDLDPWQEAANFAGMPKQTAIQRLASMVAALPDEPSACREPSKSAARLIALLPRRDELSVSPRLSLDGKGAPSNRLVVKYVILVVAVMVFQSLVAVLQPPAPVDKAQASTTSAAVQKPPSVLGQ